MMAKLVDERKVQWHNVLKDVEFACNNTVSKAINNCPNMLLFGVQQCGKVVNKLRDALEFREELEMPRDLFSLRERADEQIQRNQNANKRIYDRKHKTAKKYQVGDKVMIKNFDNSPDVSQKMISRFKGPYQVDRVLRNDRYVIKDIEGSQLSQTPYRGTWEAANMRSWTPG
jgi:hypothetical protein